jgi:hypothetical protein
MARQTFLVERGSGVQWTGGKESMESLIVIDKFEMGHHPSASPASAPRAESPGSESYLKRAMPESNVALR